MGNYEDEFAKLDAEKQRERRELGGAGAVFATLYADFYRALKAAGMTEEQAFELTRDFLSAAAAINTDEADDD